MKEINVRAITIADLGQLQTISKQTFIETFSAVNTAENMNQYLEESFSTGRLLAELNNSSSQFYFAEQTAEVVGYLKLNFGNAQTELKEQAGLEVERIYVLQEFQGKRVGQLLFQKAMDIAKQQNADYIWLGVWEKNLKAINFYTKNGFMAFDKHVFKLGDDEQIDIMMKLNLK